MDEIGLIPFVLSVVTISMSGVLMPGPVTAVTVAGGSRDPHAGAWVAIGHGVIEFPLMALIFFGAGVLFQLTPVKIALGLGGGAVLLFMGLGMLRDYDRVDVTQDTTGRAGSPFLAGILLSLGNPYFLIWWGTAGALLIDKSLKFGLIGFLVLAVSHWLCDLIWYYFLSVLSYRGGRFFGARLQQGVFIFCGLVLLFFTGYFAGRAVLTLTRLV